MKEEFIYTIDRFADCKVMKYKVDNWNSLSLRQKHYLYHLSEACKWGRDIIWEQNCELNLPIRKIVENILENHREQSGEQWQQFVVYAKRLFFSNGIHHHYSHDKFYPECDKEYFIKLMLEADCSKYPLENMSLEDYCRKMAGIIYNSDIAPKRKETDKGKDPIEGSAVNFYKGLNRQEAEDFYAAMKPSDPMRPPATGLNSKLVKQNGQIKELTYRMGGLYGEAIEKIVENLRKAMAFAENEQQQKYTEVLIEYYTSGDLELWDKYNILWLEDDNSQCDYINAFVETYNDPLGMKATWEGLVDFKDFDASRRCEVLSQNAQWFEDHSPIEDRFKKENVVGISAKVIEAVCLAGDNYPVPPIGINLPNSDWIRKEYGSKSVNIANLSHAYKAAALECEKSVLEEFAFSMEEKERNRTYGILADDLHTDMHECLGHGSGQLLEGTDSNALKEFSSCLEEARADLFALYYLLDSKMIELKLADSPEVGMTACDSYIMNGLLSQYARIEEGKPLRKAHMQARKLISAYCFENGFGIEKVEREGKTYFHITDYENLRKGFGELLGMIQRIKSLGEYDKAKELVERYAIDIDPILHREVIKRYGALDLKPYGGFVNVDIQPVFDDEGRIIDFKTVYPESYLSQMLHYGRDYACL
ncbi:MAG TPA: dipeptidyl peptidase 3 [Candidatus Onthomorpha intestinigallinarum]|uniref:Dipeptidyl peptidase 3 n=1 Tax=Candidatus Onthomorpha intestinigallinarum TaxID=2840880 RepID=A0A9D1RIT2_9BACT|nr:dipeptidyl peptidase 3 [Candidatus Onthomorpha intestinigallinarum]